jgi:hypothetical protein
MGAESGNGEPDPSHKSTFNSGMGDAPPALTGSSQKRS